MDRTGRIALAVAALFALGVGCTGAVRDADARPSGPPPAPVVTIVAREYAYQLPGRVPAGVTTLRLENRGQRELHHAQLFRLDSGKTMDDVRVALKAKWPPPAWMVMLGGPSNVWPGESTEMTVALAPGTYALACDVPLPDGTPHHAQGLIATFTVTSAGDASATPAEPTADAAIMLREYSFALPQRLAAGVRTFRVENAGAQPHEVMLTKLDPGATMADLKSWFDRPTDPRWPLTVVGGVNGVSPGQHAFFSAKLTAGEYVLICLADDVTDGRMHIRHGMMRTVTVR